MSIATQARDLDGLLESWRTQFPAGSPEIEQADNQVFRFNLWTSNNFVFESPRASMDWRLRNAPLLQSTLEDLLNDLKSSLTYELASKVNRESEKQDSENRAASDDIEDLLNQLFRFTRAIRRSGALHRFVKFDNFIEYSKDGLNLTELFRESARKLVEHHLKGSSANPTIKDRLIDTICLRRQNFAYLKARKKRISSQHTPRPKTTEPSIPPLSVNSTPLSGKISHSAAPQTPKDTKENLPRHIRRSVMTETAAKWIPARREPVKYWIPVRKPVNYWIPSPSTDLNSEDENDESSLPRAPFVPVYWKEWECPYCLIVCPRKEFIGHNWNKHIIADTMPYICIMEPCPTPNTLFGSFHDWRNHMENEHAVGRWTCVDNAHESGISFESESLFRDHMKGCHAGDFDESDLDEIVDACFVKRAMAFSVTNCPFCQEILGQSDPIDLLRHISRHLLELSRISLSSYEDGEGDVTESIISEQTDHDSGNPSFSSTIAFELQTNPRWGLSKGLSKSTAPMGGPNIEVERLVKNSSTKPNYPFVRCLCGQQQSPIDPRGLQKKNTSNPDVDMHLKQFMPPSDDPFPYPTPLMTTTRDNSLSFEDLVCCSLCRKWQHSVCIGDSSASKQYCAECEWNLSENLYEAAKSWSPVDLSSRVVYPMSHYSPWQICTFRISHIHPGWDSKKLCLVLEHRLRLPHNVIIRVESLAIDHTGLAKVAVVAFPPIVAQALRETYLPNRSFWIRPTGDYAEDDWGAMTVDQHYEGLTVLYTPEDMDQDVDICAIAGLDDNAWGSFASRETSYMWIVNRLHLEFPTARIMIYGPRTDGDELKSIRELKENFEYDMLFLRSPSRTKPVPLFFIAYDLGGLILRQALLKSHHLKNVQQGPLGRFRGALFFGVPHHGLHVDILQAMNQDRTDQGFPFFNKSRILKHLGEYFKEVISSIAPISYYYEKKPQMIAKLPRSTSEYVVEPNSTVVVGMESAIDGEFLTSSCHGLDRDHSSLVKFNRDDADLNAVVAELSKMIHSTSEGAAESGTMN